MNDNMTFTSSWKPTRSIAAAIVAAALGLGLSPISSTALSAAAATSTGVSTATITGAKGDTVVVEITGTTVRVKGKIGETRLDLVGLRKDDKRKYAQAGKETAEVKLADDGFKLRTTTGALKWKLKATAEKIKLLDGEEDVNLRYVIKKKADDRWEVRRGEETEIGNVRGGAKVKVKDVAGKEVAVIDGKFSPAYGVMLLNDVPVVDRAILLGELMVRS